MNNHIHLLIEPETNGNVSRFIKLIAGEYACYFNKIYNRTGTLWEGRFKCSLVKSERYFISCLHYIEGNPVRAGIIGSAGQYNI
jgi:putative transposase